MDEAVFAQDSGATSTPHPQRCNDDLQTMTRVAIIAALPGELKPLVRGWPNSSRNNIHFWAQRNEEEEWMAACAGAGQAAATRAFAAIEDGGPIDLVFSYGWAGALTTEIASGSAHNAAGVIDARTGERFRCDAGAGDRWLVTSPIVADHVEKQRLASAYDADLAQMRGIPFYCVKGISDGFTDRLPDFNRFIRRNGQFDLTAMVLFSILRPWYWPGLIRMGENSSRAARSMAETLFNFLSAETFAAREDSDQRNGDPDHPT
jgi:adenosylhomocysteine nucleosidase